MATADGMTIRWKTSVRTASHVFFGKQAQRLSAHAGSDEQVVDHEVALEKLEANTVYHYVIETGIPSETPKSQPHSFKTVPTPGDTPTAARIWIVGDSGTADDKAASVRDGYLKFSHDRTPDAWLMLGDNAYREGSDEEYQRAVFDMYPRILASTPLWPAFGNHDGRSSNASRQEGPYFDIFTLPTQGQVGGVASGSEAYYSFDYGGTHFVVLDSYGSDRSPDGSMLTWLRSDLERAKNYQWRIAFWHHPPYSRGSHNSDQEDRLREMRENALPIIEAHGVNLVFSGHSHSYERSKMLNGHYGSSDSLTKSMLVDDGSKQSNKGNPVFTRSDSEPGTVYVVVGSSGDNRGGALNHPVMAKSINTLGSVVLDITPKRLTSSFINIDGEVLDKFSIARAVASEIGVPDDDQTSLKPPRS